MGNEPQDAVSFAAQLKLLRIRLGLSQEQLARKLGVSFATVNRWEAGRSRPSARACAAIAELQAADGGRRTQQAAGSAGLPLAQSSFVGRERELAELLGLLARARLLTLTGPGGAGKTRLAVEAIRRWQPAAAGDLAFVALEAVRPPRSVASALAARLGIRERPPLHASLLAAAAGPPRLLLVFDGAEYHREEVAGLAADLLAAAPGLRIVVTSRVVLGAPGEVCWAVPPLDFPSAAAGEAEIASADAVRLFLTRAADRLPGLAAADVPPHAVGELCRRLGGLPLAIELIAGWAGTLSVGEILQHRVALLGCDSPGGRKLAGVLRASYDLLEPGQQRTLRLLSVFAGPFGLAAAAAVLGCGEPAAAAAARGLVDASWLAVIRGAAQNRFAMVETIRLFSAARLEEAAEAEDARHRHARHFAAMAADYAADRPGNAGAPDMRGWMARLEAAADDLHATLQWAADAGEAGLGLEVSTALSRWWLASGRTSTGKAWLGTFLALAGGDPETWPRQARERVGRALCAAGTLAAESADYAEAVRLSRQAIAVLEPLARSAGRSARVGQAAVRPLSEDLALAATVLGAAHRYRGERAEARRHFQTALDLRREAGDRARLLAAMNNMALAELDDGNLERARELFEQTLIIKRQLGDSQSIATGLVNLADVLIKTGQWQGAQAALAEAAELTAGQPQLTSIARCNQGHLAAQRRDWKQAAERYRTAVAESRAGGHTHIAVEAMTGLGRACYHLGLADEAARQLHAAEALADEIGNRQLLAEARAALAEIAAGGESDGPPGRLPGNLTGRQAEVLRLLADGLRNKQIAERLCLSPGTVERHLATIYHKLGVGGRVDAARFAVESGLARRDVIA